MGGFIATEAGDDLLTEGADFLVTEDFVPEIVLLRGGPARKYVPEFDFRTLRAEFRKGDEYYVLQEIAEEARTAIGEERKPANAAALAREIKRQRDIRLTMDTVERLITRIRNDKAFRAEAARIAREKQQEEDDEAVLLLIH